jgi:hypothetical protein
MRTVLPLLLLLGAFVAWWSPGGARRDAPAHACPTITRAEFDSAVTAGATSASIDVAADGTSDLRVGPGVVSCATYAGSAMKPCKRPNDLVIAYSAKGAAPFYVKVPAGREYRFNVAAAPNTCEILDR